jgi:uncharacterized membrane protein YukC
MDRRTDKQEAHIGFVQKCIPPYGMPKERVYKNFKHLRCVVAEETACDKSLLQTNRHTHKGKTVYPPLLQSRGIKKVLYA